MKLRITPLNFASAFFLFAAVYSWIYGIKISGSKLINLGNTIGWIFILFAFVVSFMDIMFRNFFPEIKKVMDCRTKLYNFGGCYIFNC